MRPKIRISAKPRKHLFLFPSSQAYSSPKDDPELSEEEKKIILGGSKPREPVTVIPWKLILSKPPVWALIISHFCHNWGTFILLTWMPTYYNQACTSTSFNPHITNKLKKKYCLYFDHNVSGLEVQPD